MRCCLRTDIDFIRFFILESMGKRRVICGIYKITSPTGRVYIGQSENIYKRWTTYKNMNVSTKAQTKLWRSFKKHYATNHLFEIVEECIREDLNCTERFWQDEYDVLNGGLNCMLTECGDQKREWSEESKKTISKVRIEKGLAVMGNNSNAKKVINYKTEEILDCAKELVKRLDVNYSTLMGMLIGNNFNKTDWCFLSDYESGEYKNNLKPTYIDKGEEVICVRTLKTWRNITTCAKENNIVPQNLMDYLNPTNNRNNPTSFVHLSVYTALTSDEIERIKEGNSWRLHIKWTFEKVTEEALKYKTRKEFQVNSRGAYGAATTNKWLEIVCKHMVTFSKPKGYWTLEVAIQEAKKYKTKKEFKENCISAYRVCSDNGVLNNFFPKYSPRISKEVDEK